MMPPRRLRRVLMVVAGVCGVGAALALLAIRRYRLPSPTGPYAVGTCILNLTDEARAEPASPNPATRRELVVQLWYPAAPSQQPVAKYQRWPETTWLTAYAALLPTNSGWNAPFAAASGPFPVLLYGHRWNGERTQNTALAEDLASHGYVVAAIDHPYQASRVLLADGHVVEGTEAIEGPPGPKATAEQQIDFWNRNLDLWAADARFVLDQLAQRSATPSNPLHSHLDTDHAGAFGHSFGGAVALRLCGLDPRIQAAVNLDGWTFGGLTDRTAAQPVMILYEGVYNTRRQELETLPQPGTAADGMDRADNRLVDANLAQNGGYRMVIANSQHMDFTDQPLLPPLHRGRFTGNIDPVHMQSLLRASLLQFFNQSLRSQPSVFLRTQPKNFSEIHIEHFAAPSEKITAK